MENIVMISIIVEYFYFGIISSSNFHKFSFLLLNLILKNKIKISHLNDELDKVPWYLKNQSVLPLLLNM
jgi:hypothetical protein